MRRSLGTSCSALLLFGLAACGGGGGGASPGSPDPTPDPSVSSRVEEVLEACALEGVAAFAATMAELEPVLRAEAPPSPDFQVTGIDLLGASLSWTLDADADGELDLSGTMRFSDAAGSPSWPFDPATLLALLAGTADVSALLATLPDGTRVAVDYVLVGAPVPLGGSLETTFVDGVPTTASGHVDFPGSACQVGLVFSDLPAALLYDPMPSGVFDLHGTTAEGRLDGTLTLHGNGTATIDVLLDGGNRTVWDYDLATGVLTPRP
jgi:hypothetical protein